MPNQKHMSDCEDEFENVDNKEAKNVEIQQEITHNNNAEQGKDPISKSTLTGDKLYEFINRVKNDIGVSRS
jgi:hypothetical protein